ncbi:MAG: DUF86 domain-containing protein [Deltaproteobacteria bacterium]|nr:DUF86 domain-containing protein [Deltaproteobacteria bacterium]
MVDRDILRAKSAAIKHHVGRIRSRLPLEAATLESDEDLRNVVLMDLQQAIQGAIDMAVHACVDDGLGPPEGPASAFAALAGAGYMSNDLAVRLAGASGFRNLIVHRYGDLKMDILIATMEKGLNDLEEFVAAVWRRAGEPREK